MSQFQHRACCHWHCCHTRETELSLTWLVALVSQNVCCERGLWNQIMWRKENCTVWMKTFQHDPHPAAAHTVKIYEYNCMSTHKDTHMHIHIFSSDGWRITLIFWIWQIPFNDKTSKDEKYNWLSFIREVLQQFSNNRHWVLRLWLFTTLCPNITWRMIDHKVLPSSWLNEIVINWEEAASVKFKKKNAK